MQLKRQSGVVLMLHVLTEHELTDPLGWDIGNSPWSLRVRSLPDIAHCIFGAPQSQTSGARSDEDDGALL